MKFLIDGSATLAIKQGIAEALTSRHAAEVSVFNERYVENTKTLLTEVVLAKKVLVRINEANSAEPNYWYHYRFVWVPSSNASEAADDIVAVTSRNRLFISTRGTESASLPSGAEESVVGPATFLGVVRDGLAQDGGLFVPRTMIPIPKSQLEALFSTQEMNYHDVAQVVLERLVDLTELPPGVLQNFISHAYSADRWDAPDVCPLTPLLHGRTAPFDPHNDIQLLELYHGPTAAFKDFALQLFPYMFEHATTGMGDYMILAATSGDTGVAAIVGFLNSSPHTKVMVLYPKDGVSPVQKAQMLSTDDGGRIRVFGVEGDFDFCQSTVKDIFQDSDLAASLQREHHLTLSSANSINYGRLIPQVVYYFWAYRQLIQRGNIQLGGEIDVCVPSGNFGNILSSFVAMKLGLPIRRFIVASNCNDVLVDFINTGVYDISQRSLHVTASPSIDILKASNIERFLYYLTDGNTSKVAAYMNDLNTKKRFCLNEQELSVVKRCFSAVACSEDVCSDVIKDIFEASGGSRLLDPHTAVGVHAAKKMLVEADVKRIPLIVAATAHWAKFPQPVLDAIRVSHSARESSATIDDLQNMYEAIGKLAIEKGAVALPHSALQSALRKAKSASGHERVTSRDRIQIVTELQTFVSGSGN